MSCECYPPNNYPAHLRKGCAGVAYCWVRAESATLRQPGGREKLLAEYHAESSAVAEKSEEKPESRDVLSRCQRLGVPSTEMLLAINNTKPTEAMRMAQLWWGSDRKTFPALVMAGDVGVGKTVASAWCALEWAKGYPWNKLPTGSNVALLVWMAGTAMRKLGEWGEEAQDLLAGAATAELTIIDDAGRDGDRRAHEALSDLVMERLDRSRATVLSSNMKGEQFRARYGLALADRLRSRAVVVSAKGDSMRRRPEVGL